MLTCWGKLALAKKSPTSTCGKSDSQKKVCLPLPLFPRASAFDLDREGTITPDPPTEQAAMARRVVGSGDSSVSSGVSRDQRSGVAARSAAMIPSRTSGGRLAHAATSLARSASGGALPQCAPGRDVGETRSPVGPSVGPVPAPSVARGADRAAPGAARFAELA